MLSRTIGAQLYTVREFCDTKENLEITFQKLKNIGFKSVQVSGIGDIPAADVKKAADENGLDIICTHRPWEQYKNDLDGIVKYHKDLDCTIAGLGMMPKVKDITKEKLFEFIENANEITRALKKEGISFAYHNHASEFRKLDGKYIMDYLLEEGEFDFIVDVYWLAYAAINPAEFIRRVGKRARIIHFKDLEIFDNQSRISEVMEGNLNWDEIIAACDDAGAEYAFIEQDICLRNPFDCLKTSYDNLKTKGFN